MVRYYDRREFPPWSGAPAAAMPYYMAPGMHPYMRADPYKTGTYAPPLKYPEVYYILQPHIMKAAGQLELYGQMPTESMLEAMSNEIENDVSKLHPELAEHTMMMEESMSVMNANSMENQLPNMQEDMMQEQMPNEHGNMMQNPMSNMHENMMQEQMPNMRGNMMQNPMSGMHENMMQDRMRDTDMMQNNLSVMPDNENNEQPFPARFEDYRTAGMQSDYPMQCGMENMHHAMHAAMPVRRRKGLLNDIIRILLLSELFRRRRRRYYY